MDDTGHIETGISYTMYVGSIFICWPGPSLWRGQARAGEDGCYLRETT